VRSSETVVRLGEVLRRSDRLIDLEPTTLYKRVTVRLWGKGVVQRDEVAGAEIAAARQMAVRTGQFILSRIDARNGALGIVPECLDGGVVSSDFPVFTPDEDRLLPAFLGWMSKTGRFVDLCRVASEGTTNRVRLKEERFAAMQIPLPPIPEQRRIVARIDELAAKIEEARGLRREAMEEAGALVTTLHLSLSGPLIVRLCDILVLDEDRDAVRPGGIYPQVGVKGFGEGLFPKPPVQAFQTTYKVFNRLYEGALVLSQVKGWEGAVAVCPPALAGRYVSPEYRTFRAVAGMALPEYLAPLVATPWFWERLRGVTRGMGGRRERTRPEQFLQLEIPMPSEDDQRRALPLLHRLRPLARLQEETAVELDAMLPAVLERAFRGEL